MNQTQYKKQSKITINISNKNTLFPPIKSLKSILKEKLLYDHLCSIHHCNYFKYCTTCQKDICYKCEIESHKNHKSINYENILPDLNEINIIQWSLKEYQKNHIQLLNILKKCKDDFDNMLKEYENKVNNIIEYINKFNNEKNNFNSIYKYRSVCSLLLNSKEKKDEKNNRIIEMMENILKEKEINKDKYNYIQKIKKDYNCLLSYYKLKDLIYSLNNETFINRILKIINIIDYKKESNYNINIKNNSDSKTPNLNFYKNNNISSYTKNNTSASTFGKHYYKISDKDNNQTINQNTKENSIFKINPYTYRNIREEKNNHSKSTNDIISKNIKKSCIYEKKKIRENSNNFNKNSSIDKYEKRNFLNLNNNTYNENTSRYILNSDSNAYNEISKNKFLNKNNLQESINKIKIKTNQNIYNNYINSNCNQKIIRRKKRNNLIPSKTQNIVNKSLFYDYKGFDINDKDSGPELLNNSSYTIQGVKYYSNSLRSNSLEYRPFKYKYFSNLGKTYITNSYSLDNKNRNLTMENNNSDYGLMNYLLTLNDKSYKTINNLNDYDYNRKKYRLNFERNNNKNNNSSLVNFFRHKMNNSELNINKQTLNNSLFKNPNNNNTINSVRIENYNLHNKLISNKIYNNHKKNKKIYVHKKYFPIEELKNLSSIDSESNSIASSIGESNNNKNNTKENKTMNKNNKNKYVNANTHNNIFNEIHINANKPLFIGLELGNNECKIGVINKNNNYEIFKYNNNYSIPTIISFIENNSDISEIKIGEEAQHLTEINPSQTIFNIIKLIGKNSNEIVGRKELWPFNIFYHEKSNKPYIKIKHNKNKYINYNFEEILTIFLKKLFELFFNRIFVDNINKFIDLNINIVVSVPNYYNFMQRKLIENIFISKLFPKIEEYKKNGIFMKQNIYGKYNLKLNNIHIENVSNLSSFTIIEEDNINHIKNKSLYYLILYIEGGSINISIINISNKHNNYIIEVRGINGDEFGEEDFIDNFIYNCLSNLKDKIKKSCLASPTSMAKLRRSLNIAKNSFNKDGISQIEVSINKLNDATDLKITINKKDYIKSCIGLFRKIIYLIKDVILKSNIDIKDINDIFLIGDITQNIKLKNMISEIFKDNNKKIYNKLTNKINENGKNIDNYTIKGAIIQCFNNNMINPKYKLINITQSSFGIESINGIMDIVIEKGSNIPIKFNKFIKVQIPEKSENNNYININIYEGENKFVKNNRLISSRYYSLKNFKNEKKDEKSIEILFQFFIDSKNNLNVCVLDKDNFRKKIECLNNRNYI